ncbi:MAG: hypothetical protein JW995_14695 [Melioribacteraceae bacterium]|nr:hypothetical protein [Melioribacteraceae bacterium]
MNIKKIITGNYLAGKLSLFIFLWSAQVSFVNAQGTPEQAVAQMKMGKLWAGVTANGGTSTFEYRAGFFPNDYGILGHRGQYYEAYTGGNLTLATTGWYNPDPLVDSVVNVAIYRMVNQYMTTGKVLEPMRNYIRYKYPQQVIDFQPLDLTDFGEYNPGYPEFQNYTFDQVVEVTNEHIFGTNPFDPQNSGPGIKIKRKIMSWSQTFHDNYIISDVELENVTDSTWENFYISIQENAYNVYFSNGSNPAPPASERFNPAETWQHYHGGRASDTSKTFVNGAVSGKLRVYYEYSADDPRSPGDNMGAPVPSQDGRLTNPNMIFYTILHASKQPYSDASEDEDDFLQPRVTYTGKATEIPYNQANDEFGSSNFYAIRGGYAADYPMQGDIFEGTYHGLNPDELGVTDYADYVAGYPTGAHEKTVAFGPYTFEPGKKIRLVWASGTAGIGFEKGKEIGNKWINGTLDNPPNMPDAETGWLPSDFKFPIDATEMDKRKDRWISMGIDSVMLTAARAKWNFDNNYNVPQSPPPPDYVNITGLGTGVEIAWSDPGAEAMPNFAGYRIMRRISAADTVFYEPIYDSGPDDIAADHLYIDNTVLPGAQYYYYVQAKAVIDENDMSAHPLSRGKIIYSSRLLHPNVDFIDPPRLSQDDLSKIRIVPNPYNINDPALNDYGWTDKRGLVFFNLPGTVTVKIYTENGDLVQTLEHDSPVKAGSFRWDMITSNQQVISSGVYIAVFEKPNGEISYQKFIVVR